MQVSGADFISRNPILRHCGFKTEDHWNEKGGSVESTLSVPDGIAPIQVAEELQFGAQMLSFDKWDVRVDAMDPQLMEEFIPNTVIGATTIKAVNWNEPGLTRPDGTRHLAQHGQHYTSLGGALLVAAYHRVDKGFPETRELMGTSKDPGDWLRTKSDSARGVRGARMAKNNGGVHLLATCEYGIIAHETGMSSTDFLFAYPVGSPDIGA